MAKIKKIRLTDLMFYNTVTHRWENLYAVDTAVGTERDLGPGSQYKPVLYDAGSRPGLDPDAPYNCGLNWEYFDIDDGTGVSEEWTLFYTGTPPEGTHLLADTIKSLRVRYKNEVEVDSDPANTFAPKQYYYQIINGAYPPDHFLYMGNITPALLPPPLTSAPRHLQPMVTTPPPTFPGSPQQLEDGLERPRPLRTRIYPLLRRHLRRL
jgi:hypothetical protein